MSRLRPSPGLLPSQSRELLMVFRQKAQELTKEELEQVNGGKVTIQDILKSTTAILMFP